MNRSIHGILDRDIILALAVILITLTIYTTLYYISLTALRPYREIMINFAQTPLKPAYRPIVNETTVAMFISSPFNAYEAVILHVDPWTYFLKSIVYITIIFSIIILLLHPASAILLSKSGKQVRSHYTRFTAYAMVSAIALSYAVSAIVWLVLGIPSIGTSIYAEFLIVAGVAVTIKIVKHLITVVWEVNKLHHLWIIIGSIVLIIVIIALLLRPSLSEVESLIKSIPHFTGLLLSILTTYLLIRKIN